jgi:DNA-binding IclR family transcriptional regulator
MFEYGQLALSRLSLFEVSVPILAVLRDRVRDLVQLGIPIGAEILFLDRFEASNLDPRQLSEILEQVRRRGYDATDEELEEGISSVAAPVCVTDALGRRAIAAVSEVGPSPRLHRDGIVTVARHAKEAAHQIGRAMSSLRPDATS